MKTIIFLLSMFIAFFIRFLRWLAILQQKEYRLDRLMLFLKTQEGKSELIRIIPKKSDFTKKGLKRPKFTLRIVLTFIIFLLFLVSFFSILLVFLLVPFLFFSNEAEFFLRSGIGIEKLLWLFFVVSLTSVFFLLIIPIIVVLISFLLSFFVQIFKILYLYTSSKKVLRLQPMIIGLTGSYGKSTTRHLLADILRQQYSVATPDASINTSLGIARWILKNYKDEKLLLLEYGAYAKGEIAKLAHYFQPEIAIITGLAPQHVGLFGNYEKLIEAKTELLDALPGHGEIFFSEDSRDVIEMINQFLNFTKRPATSYSKKILRKLPAENTSLAFKYNELEIRTALFGDHYLENIAGAITVAKHLGVQDLQIKKALENFAPRSGFILQRKNSEGTVIIDDSKTANPKGVKVALDILSSFKKKRKIMVFGGIVDLGEVSDEIHQELAELAEKNIDECWYVGEVGKDIWSEVLGKKCLVDREHIKKKVKEVTQDDVVLLEGFIPGYIQL